ncbi:DoxX family protein (plasmid) [Rhodococcus opacus]|uniref:DoxX family protein n=1 Tax=Rhodococcus opacus M213 TaxID=1129896 RepID=K8XBX8_RHOOP|nr:DoxX family protein [Rhodococcus opacus]EKT79018.1 DoxX family protein [Rhodococcus opacus M213]ELB91914.1 DoxX family protein [Rhodococcus wratislaviensis IFP 2016]WKN59931.1 DoxX family protein [Rhodococcus opacus]
MDIGLLALRLLIAAVLFAHATQKAFGWFSGPGLAKAESQFTMLGQEPAAVKVRLAITCELSAAVLLALGLATPLGAIIATATMLVAGYSLITLNKSFWAAAGGGEYPIVLAALAGVIAFTGPGAYAVDEAIGVLPFTAFAGGGVAGLVVVVTATVAAAPVILSTRRSRANQSTSSS